MLSRTLLRRSAATMAAIEAFIPHLRPARGADLQPIGEVLPGAPDGIEEAYKFQRLFVDYYAKSGASAQASRSTNGADAAAAKAGAGSPLVALKIVSPQNETMKALKVMDPVFTPVVSASVIACGESIPQQLWRIQYVEFCLLLRINPKNGEPQALAPALAFTGSRWHFYAPHAPGFVADLCGHCALVVGEEIGADVFPLGDAAALGAVLTLNDDPVAVGYGRGLCNPQLALQQARELAPAAQFSIPGHKRGSTPASGDESVGYLLATAVCTASWGPRTPAKLGRYEANFGPIGSVVASLS